MNKIAIYGAGGLGKEVLTIIEAINEVSDSYDFIGFFDDDYRSNVLGSVKDINVFSEELSVVVAIGNPELKRRLVNGINNPKISFPSLIHPSVIAGDMSRIQIGEGAIIAAGAVLTLDIIIEKHVLVNLNSTIGHDVTIKAYSSIMPGTNISGNVCIGNQSFIGSGVNVINNLHIGDNTIIGAGAVVISNIESNCTAVGVPATKVKKSI